MYKLTGATPVDARHYDSTVQIKMQSTASGSDVTRMRTIDLSTVQAVLSLVG
jgi:hypothetical protein